MNVLTHQDDTQNILFSLIYLNFREEVLSNSGQNGILKGFNFDFPKHCLPQSIGCKFLELHPSPQRLSFTIELSIRIDHC